MNTFQELARYSLKNDIAPLTLRNFKLQNINLNPNSIIDIHSIGTLRTPNLISELNQMNFSLAVNSPFRIIKKNSKLTLKNPGSNFLPIKGVSFFLNQIVAEGHAFTKYLNLSNVSLHDQEIIMSGIGTHIVEEKKIDLLFEGLNKLQKDGIKMDFETIDNYIEENFSEPQPSQSDFENFYLLKQDNLKIIDTCFESYDLEKILKTLNKNIKNEFSKSTLECLESQDKLTLTATLLKLEMAAVLDFKSSLIFEEKVEKALLKIEDENLDKSKFTKKELNLFIEKNFEKILEEDQFLNNTTFNTYRWESVTSLPTKKIISEMIKGEIGGGEMARTKREVLNWFDEYWFKHLEKESNFKELDLEEEFLPKVETFNEGDAINKNVYYKTRRYAVNQWISFCIDRYCELVNDKYLKWKW